MNIYQSARDRKRNIPLVLLIYRDAFIVGDKRDEFNVCLAKYYTRCGYAVAYMNHRCGFVFIPGIHSDVGRAMYMATLGARAALCFLSDNYRAYGINPKFCFVRGNSAGGFISLLPI